MTTLHDTLYPHLSQAFPTTELPVDPRALVHHLVASVQYATRSKDTTIATAARDLQRLYLSSTTPATLHEQHLPLLGRMLGRTIGVIGEEGELVCVPHQWLTRGKPVVDVNGGDSGMQEFGMQDDGIEDGERDAFEEWEDDDEGDLDGWGEESTVDPSLSMVGSPSITTPLLLRRTAPHRYRLDTDDDRIQTYVDEYLQLSETHSATTSQWNITTDTYRLEWAPPDAIVTTTTPTAGPSAASTTSSPSASSSSSSTASSTTSSTSSVREWTSRTSFLSIGSPLPFKKDKRLQQQFAAIWADGFRFDPADDPKHQSTASQPGTYPHIHSPHFVPEVYQCPGLVYPMQLRRTTNTPASTTVSSPTSPQTPPLVTFQDHQQLVRTFFSPLTPYHSLLLVHSTGTGKTFTTFGITEPFRDWVRHQGKTIHIACPRPEVSDEFRSYLRVLPQEGTTDTPPRTPAEYIQQHYAHDNAPTYYDRSTNDTRLDKDVYTIDTYRRIFNRHITDTLLALQGLYLAWFWICPRWTSIRRTTDGFELRAASFRHTEDIATLQTSLNRLAKSVTKDVGHLLGNTPWTYAVTHRPSSGLLVRVTETYVVDRFERAIVSEFANTLFVMDEAHNYTDSAGDTGDAGDTSDDSKNEDSTSPDAQNTQDETSQPSTPTHRIRHAFSMTFVRFTNWRVILRTVMAILRHHRHRMRLLLLTATPMTNRANDLGELVNLMIFNDGWKHERLLRSYAREKPAYLLRSMQGRLSYFSSQEGKPTALAPEDVWYTVPSSASSPSSPSSPPLVSNVVRGTALDVLVMPNIDAFMNTVRSPEWGIPCTQWDWRTWPAHPPTSKTTGIPTQSLTPSLTQSSTVGTTSAPTCTTTQSYVYLVLADHTSYSRDECLQRIDAFARHTQPHHTIVVVAATATLANRWANDSEMGRRLYARTSMKRAL